MKSISVFSLLIFFALGLMAQDCLTGPGFFRLVTIDNSAGPALSDVQVPVSFQTDTLVSAGKLQPDASDLWVVNADCEPLPFFLDSLTSASSNTLWVRLPAVPAGGTVSFELYYGGSASPHGPDGDSTFLFFDDFSGDSVDLDKWQPIGGYATLAIEDGALAYASNGSNPGPRFKFVRTAMAFDEEVVFDYSARITNSNGVGFSSADDTISRILFRQSIFGFDTLNQVALMLDTTSNGYQVEGMYPLIRYPRFEYRHATIRTGLVDSVLTFTYFANLTESSAQTDTFALTQVRMGGFHFLVSSFLSAQTVYLDYLRVRRDLPETLMATVGEEGALVASSLRDLIQLDLSVSPNPSLGQVRLQGLPGGSVALQLFDLQGRRVWSQKSQATMGVPLQLDLGSQPVGWYSLLCTDEQGRIGRVLLQLRDN
ncbi:MAG: DUF2341 domain-containing protein [Bacteroidetes bacterium]|nr:MAG: DUF2341 domain-containing protein [Bacteroidota bacterium]